MYNSIIDFIENDTTKIKKILEKYLFDGNTLRFEEDLLCPFHYFGITDLHMISDEGKTKEEQLENFRYLTSDERVKYVMDQAK